MLTVHLLGGASIEGEAGPLTGPAAQRHRLALLAVLATAHPGGLGREKAMGVLWPERDAEHARNLLKQAVHVLRKALGEAAIVSAGDQLRLDPLAVRVDVIEFEEALAAGDRERAVGLHRGPFLDGLFLPDALEFERWLDGERERLRRACLKALEELAEGAAARGDRAGAAEWWRRLAAEEPYNSHVTVRLMEALEAAGDRAGAIHRARLHAERLRGEFEAEPSPEVVALAERMRTEPSARRVGQAARPAAETGPVRVAPDARPPAQPSVPADAAAAAAGGARSGGAGEAGEERARATAPPAGRSRKRAGALVMAVAMLAAAGWAITTALPADSPEIRRMAVLPLANHTGDPNRDYFVAGMHDALIAALGGIADLTVISRQSVLRYEGSDEPLPVIARELGVDAVVEGSVFLAGDSVRVTAQLIRAAPEEHLWAETYRGSVREALALQGEVARAIARAVHARVMPEERARLASARTVKPEAQEVYLRGLSHLEQYRFGRLAYWLGTGSGEPPETIRTGLALLEEAVTVDPEWAAAHAKLALGYQLLAADFPALEPEYYPKSKAAALRALELDETEAQAHASFGFALFFFEWDWAEAERAFRRALDLDSNAHHADYATYLHLAGRYDEAIAHYRSAEERNPLSRDLKRQLVVTFFCAGRYDEALAQAEHVSRLWPDHEAAYAMHYLGQLHSAKSRDAQAIAAHEEAVTLSDSATWAVAALAAVYARADRQAEGRALLQWLEGRGRASYMPALYAALGQSERAVAMVEAAVHERGLRPFWVLRCYPEYEALRAEPRVQEILRRIGFPN